MKKLETKGAIDIFGLRCGHIGLVIQGILECVLECSFQNIYNSDSLSFGHIQHGFPHSWNGYRFCVGWDICTTHEVVQRNIEIVSYFYELVDGWWTGFLSLFDWRSAEAQIRFQFRNGDIIPGAEVFDPVIKCHAKSLLYGKFSCSRIIDQIFYVVKEERWTWRE